MTDAIDAELLAAGEAYEALFVPALFTPWVERVVATARINPGEQVLDLSCGTGALTRALLPAVQPEGQVTGVDPAAGMLAVARRLAPQADLRLETAEAMSLPAAAFDTVVCQFGAMFFSDRTAAIAQVKRVLKPGGKALFLVWDALPNNPVYALMARLFKSHFGAAAGDAMAVPFSLGDPEVLASEFRAAGFTVAVETARETADFPTIRQLIEAELYGWLPLFDIDIDSALGEAVIDEAAAALSEYVDDTGRARFPMSAHLVHASV